MPNFLDAFESECYVPQFQTLFTSTDAYIASHYDEIKNQFIDSVEQYCRIILKEQNAGNIGQVSFISISFLYSTFQMGRPQFQIDCYPDGWCILNKSLYSSRIDASWLTKYVDVFRDELITYSKKQGLVRFIRPERISVFVLRAVRALLMFSTGASKYFFQGYPAPELYKLQNGEPLFITYGELGDWQKLVWGRRPDVDIFNCDEDTPLTFREFILSYYQNKEFCNLTLNYASFKNCSFTDCAFDNCQRNDITFENCTFVHTTIRKSTFFGAAFIQCSFKDVTFEEDDFDCPISEQQQEIYRRTTFANSELSTVSFHDCNFGDCALLYCECNGIKVIGDVAETSEFFAFQVTEDKGEDG